MIETKILGEAVGVQRQDVIDKSETTVLPSLANGVMTGHFKRGRMDKPFKVTARNYKALLGHDPSNPSYLAVEDAFKNGVSEVSILRTGGMGGIDGKCKPIPSKWSNPITFDMVNKPTGNGGIQVDFGDPDYETGEYFSLGGWINLAEMSTIEEFFEAVNKKLHYDSLYQLGVKSNGDGSVLIRVESKEGVPPDEARSVFYAAKKAVDFYVYDSSNIGNNAEATINLANAFADEVTTFVLCEYTPTGGVPT